MARRRRKDKKKWRKIGGGFLILFNGKRIKPNEVFYADESEIPLSFRDVVKEIE